ncbi:phosphoribosylamine--glycine ligase [Sutterella sp.]|uniref:phosphoribosylamine--glycine ligase n=1 Tax=Sutterella sp. TaxID=1981025 RepID=UPI0026DFD269|nr:phosphoribosylamine--glycine ligase [Sutterella sp.]MDO5530638.1 phosphoribosylamine--glycine ligase [Sutterella sp.]
MKKLLVIGSGGREHALAWRLAQGADIEKVYVAPGNAGTAATEKLENLPLSAHADLIEFVKKEGIAFTVVGPEAPLAAGVVDDFRAAGLGIFGPEKAAAQLESSKDFAKAFMKRHGIPTADYETFTDPAAARAYVEKKGAPIVIKADGLAAGKGVVVAMTLKEATDAIDSMLEGHQFGQAGARVVIEDFLAGEEASFIVMVDGEHILPLATSQDHKRLLDADKGPNTGGMGAYSPAPVVTPEIHDQVMREIIRPTVEGMAKEGVRYTGFLYAGLMISRRADGSADVRTLEFNCRMGDPETQPIMMRIRSNFADTVEAAIAGRLDEAKIEWDSRSALGVVVAARGYPEHPEKGAVFEAMPENSADARIFHAGTKLDQEGRTTVSGGRVLCAVGLGNTLREAQTTAYALARGVKFDGMQMRSDIGWRAIRD